MATASPSSAPAASASRRSWRRGWSARSRSSPSTSTASASTSPLELGATHAIDAGHDEVAKQVRAVTGRGVTFSFNTTTAPAVHSMALECLAMNGTAGFVAAPRGEWAPMMFAMLAGGRQLRGILGGDTNPRLFLPRLIDYWTQGRFPLRPAHPDLRLRRDRQGLPRLRGRHRHQARPESQRAMRDATYQSTSVRFERLSSEVETAVENVAPPRLSRLWFSTALEPSLETNGRGLNGPGNLREAAPR